MINADVDDAYLHTLPDICVFDVAEPLTDITVLESPVLPIITKGELVNPISDGIVRDQVE